MVLYRLSNDSLCNLLPVQAIEADSFIDHIELDQRIGLRLANDPKRLSALLHNIDLFAQKLAKGNDPFVPDSEMLARSVRQTALSFPGHGILDEHLIQPILTLRVSHREKFPGRGGAGRRTVGIIRLEVDDIDLRMRVVDGHADLHVMADLAISLEGSEDMTQGIWKYQRMLID